MTSNQNVVSYRTRLNSTFAHVQPDIKHLNFCTDFDKSVVIKNFKSRGWKQVSPNENWHIYWANSQNSRNIFNQKNCFVLSDYQLISHFPTHHELVRKDLLVKNIIRYRRESEREYHSLVDKTEVKKKKEEEVDSRRDIGQYLHLDFMPTTFALPSDYNSFIKEYQKQPKTTWILKPCAKSQGAGIILINKVAKLKSWSLEYKKSIENSVTRKDTYVISRYINNPLLIGGKKFDLRIYVLVTSFRPLKAYMFRNGFCRFCTVKYETNATDLDNLFIHLTNVSVQKHGRGYNNQHGGKFSVNNLKLYLLGTRGREITDQLFENIQWLIVHSLKAVANVMSNDRHCFECFGYDIIIDDNLKPWLIEVNASPSMTATTANDRILKTKLVDNILSIILPPNGIPDIRWNKTPATDALGEFQLLIDEDSMYKENSENFKHLNKCKFKTK